MIGAALRNGLRTARFLVRQRTVGFPVADEPYLDPEATEHFLGLLKAARFYLEYGSGGSTVRAARMAVPTLSVEADRFFARAVLRKIGSASTVEILGPDIGLTLGWGVPVRKTPTPARLTRWRTYVEAPLATLAGRPGFPDLILVDGRFRRACVLLMAREALARGAITNICLDDYARRNSYHALADVLGEPALHGRMATFRIGHQDPEQIAGHLAGAMSDWR